MLKLFSDPVWLKCGSSDDFFGQLVFASPMPYVSVNVAFKRNLVVLATARFEAGLLPFHAS
jgi:hypothetical protein